MTAYEYYVQCRAKNEELRKKRISSQMRGPISKKRMRALHALKSRIKSPRPAEDIEIYDVLNEEVEGESDLEQEIEEISMEIESDSNDSSNGDILTGSNASPQFFTSTNSTQVLLLLKGKIYFHGALKIRLLAGDVCILGHDLQSNKTVTAYSPRGHSFLYLAPSVQQQTNEVDTIDPVEQLNVQLRKLSNRFLRADLKEIISNFDRSTDAVLLLECDISKSIFMIENYMKEAVFPNVNTFSLRPFHQSESILRSQFMLHTSSGSGLKINPQWQDIAMTSTSRHVIIGGKGVGKSTFLRYFINRNLTQFKNVLLIDLDIGQPEMFLPQTISATVITEPILGPGYLRNKSPHKSYLFGDVNVLVSSIKYLKCVLKLLKYCHSVDEFRSMPWIVNTMGYSRGFGLELIVAILRMLKPTDLVQIQAGRAENNFEKVLLADEVNNFQFNFFDEEVRDMDSQCTYSTHICDSMSVTNRKRVWDISPKDLRYATILSKLGNILKGNAKWITDVKPVCASLEDIKIIIVNDDSIGPDQRSKTINGNLVYLCRSNDDDTDDILECYGLGIVRSVDAANSKVFLLSTIITDELRHVNALAICSIPLPTSILISQSTKITGMVPYAYSSDNFIGSKQIVPITYRPDKQMSNASVK
ncbi:hypothetical protein HA402_013020 [Bradysia odoriphaga]|nr:hypothetical protein HA402_013020 [Bradysia odoriphaga]